MLDLALTADWNDFETEEVSNPIQNHQKTQSHLSLAILKDQIAPALVSLDQLKTPDGVPTGLDVIDDFLISKGFPKGDLTLLQGNMGSGATSLWLRSVQKAQEKNKWAAWISSDCELLPSALKQKNVDLRKFLVVKKPKDAQTFFWILQELMSSSLFETISCHLTEGLLKTHQLQKLKKLARIHQVALVLITSVKTTFQSSMFSLIIDCQRDFFTIRRALHRPTPFSISRSLIDASLMPQLSSSTRTLLR